MKDKRSKRLRLRFFPEDEQALDAALKSSAHHTKSNLIRAALVFYEQVWSNLQGGFRIVYRREGAADIAVDPVAISTRKLKQDSKARSERRAKTEESIEIRVTPADVRRIELLLSMSAADTSSEVVRRAIRLYAATVDRSRDGWCVMSISPSGDTLPLSVAGLDSAPVPAYTAAPRQPAAASVSTAGWTPVERLQDLLPNSLVSMVEQLAGQEGCSADALLTDMIRAETLARLTGSRPTNSEIHHEIAEAEEPIATVVAPEPEQPAVVEKPEGHHVSKEAMEAVAQTMDRMADNIEKVMRLFGESGHETGQQAQFSDLLFDTVNEMTGGTAPAENGNGTLLTGTIEHLTVRAEELSLKLDTLVALTEHREKSKPTKSKGGERRKGGKEAPEATPEKELEGAQQWALVLARDAKGTPQQRIVKSSTIVPMASEDLFGNQEAQQE